MVLFQSFVSQNEYIHTILTLKSVFSKHYFNKPNHKTPGSRFKCVYEDCCWAQSMQMFMITQMKLDIQTPSVGPNDAIFHSSQVSPYLFTLTRKKSTNNWWLQIGISKRLYFMFAIMIYVYKLMFLSHLIKCTWEAKYKKGLARLLWTGGWT